MRVRLEEAEVDLLMSKFLLNLPVSELREDRIWLYLEKAYFYYLDEIVHLEEIKDDKLKTEEFFQLVSILNQNLPKPFSFSLKQLQALLNASYSIPVAGVIILNLSGTRVLLVQGARYGYYSFPKGKANENQSLQRCAERELREEVGIFVRIDPNRTIVVSQKKVSTFFVVNVEESIFSEKSMNNKLNGDVERSREITKIIWSSLNNLDKALPLTSPTKAAIQILKKTKSSAPLLSPFELFSGLERRSIQKQSTPSKK